MSLLNRLRNLHTLRQSLVKRLLGDAAPASSLRHAEQQDPCFSGRTASAFAAAEAAPAAIRHHLHVPNSTWQSRSQQAVPPQHQQHQQQPRPPPKQQQPQRDPDEATSATELAGLAVKLTEEDPFILHARSARSGPLRAYGKGRQEGLLRKDERQEATILALQRVYEELAAAYPARTRRHGSGLTLLEAPLAAEQAQQHWWSGLFAGRDTAHDAPENPGVKGLYMYGGVGCGKTMLMDIFISTAPPEFKLERMHFHDFMLEVHASLQRHQHTADPLALVADEAVARHRVLCLDEFFVADVADAMILHRLFDRMWDRGLTLISTSNRQPDSLYEGGLQRALFLPFIARLKNACAVHDMASKTDYRRLAHHREGLYYVTASRDEDLYRRFVELANQQPIHSQVVEVAMGRHLEIQAGGCIAYFTFEQLCNRPLGAADYIALSNAKHTLAVAGVPVFTPANRAAAYRFVTLVDVLYEHRVRLVCSAEALPQELFENITTNEQAKKLAAAGSAGDSGSPRAPRDLVVDDNLGFAKDRCISRLTEMQSSEYLTAHALAHAPTLLYALKDGDRTEDGEKRAAM